MTQLVFRSKTAARSHFSFIKDLDKYSATYRCTVCDHLFNRHFNYVRHRGVCEKTKTITYKGGVFKPKQNIFEKLDDIGVQIPEELRYSRYIATYDIESILSREDTPSNTDKTSYTQKHVLVSVSVCSNIPGYTNPKCFVYGRCESVVHCFVAYLIEISVTKYELALPEFEVYLEQIEDDRLKDELNKHIQRLCCIGFNSNRYDINVMKTELVTELLRTTTIEFAIKRSANTFMCISTPELRFLDILSYLAPG